MSFPDCSEISLTSAQRIVFAHWTAGFEAQARGIPLSGNPHFDHWAHKVRNVWREGWTAGAAVDRIAAELCPPHRPN